MTTSNYGSINAQLLAPSDSDNDDKFYDAVEEDDNKPTVEACLGMPKVGNRILRSRAGSRRVRGMAQF